VPATEATVRIKINSLLQAAGWRFFAGGDKLANIKLEHNATLKTAQLDAHGENFEKASKGFVDFLVLSSDIVLRQFDRVSTRRLVNNLDSDPVRKVTIPLPPLGMQQAIAAENEAEQGLADANQELIARFEKKTQAALARVWGEDKPIATEPPANALEALSLENV
jgi:hypothetical protein